MITQSRLKELMYYDPDTGLFTRLVHTSNRVRIGDIAGHRNADGYIKMYIDWKLYSAHRLAFLYMTGSFPSRSVDHINGAGYDNRWINIRDVTNQENQRNKKRPSNNKSGVIGVYWHRQTGKWLASIRVDYKNNHLGLFDSFFEAVCMRKSEELKRGFHENHGRSGPL